MKIKSILATLIGAIAINGAQAGTWCAPEDSGKCEVECCDTYGNVGIEYMSAFIFRGTRFADDAVAINASYEFDSLPLPVSPIIGVRHVTTLSSQANLLSPVFGNGGDQTNLFAAVQLQEICGFETTLRYDYYLYSNQRLPNGNSPAGIPPGFFDGFGDSHGALSLSIAREIACGLRVALTSTYDFNAPNAGFFGGQLFGQNINADHGSWFHTLGATQEVSLGGFGLNLGAGVNYSDNIFGSNGSGAQRASGWHSYYAEAALPIEVGCNALLTPYIGYLGTPDTWIADGISNGLLNGSSGSEVLHGGVRFSVNF